MGGKGEPGAGRPKGEHVVESPGAHEALVEAMYALVRETEDSPTIDALATRSGLPTEVVARAFSDRDALYRAVSARLLREVLSLVTFGPPTGRLEADLTALVRRRMRIFEHIAPFHRAARRARPGSAFLREQESFNVNALRAALAVMVSPYLLPDAHDALDALDVLLSLEAWERLREAQHVADERVERLLVNAAVAIVLGAKTERPSKPAPPSR
jgi:AcrR family transcriptional regulator